MTPALVAFDLDGTITPSKSPMTPDMGAALKRLLLRMPAAVLSGASWPQFERQFLPALPKDARLENLYLFPTNAAASYAFRDGTWQKIYAEEFTEAERAEVLRALDEALKETGFEEPAETWGPQIEDRGSQITFSALGQQAPIPEKQRWDPTKEKRRPLYEALVKKLPQFAIGLNATTSIDITRKGMTKAFGLRKLSEMTGIPIPQMLYVGDALGPGGNDAVVHETGIAAREVTGPEGSMAVIEKILAEDTL